MANRLALMVVAVQNKDMRLSDDGAHCPGPYDSLGVGWGGVGVKGRAVSRGWGGGRGWKDHLIRWR